MYGAVAPMLSVIVTDDEMKLIVHCAIRDTYSLEMEYGKCRKWHEMVAEEQDDDHIMLIERLRVAYNIEV